MVKTIKWDGKAKDFETAEQAGSGPLQFAYPGTCGGVFDGVIINFKGHGGGVIPRNEVEKLRDFLDEYLRTSDFIK